MTIAAIEKRGRADGRLGMSYILITHNISLMRYVADKVAVMYMGRIVISGANISARHRPLEASIRMRVPHALREGLRRCVVRPRRPRS